MFTHLKNFRLTMMIVARVVADILMVAFAFAASLVVRLIWNLFTDTPWISRTELATRYLKVFYINIGVLEIICLTVFVFAGFYTRSRIYQGRYKAMLVLNSVTLAYLIFAVFSFLTYHLFALPRSTIIISWFIAAFILVGARLWSNLWVRIKSSEIAWKPLLDRQRPIERVLVIGGAGYIGSALLPKLLEHGYKVRVLDLLLYGTEPIKTMLTHPQLEIIQDDFRYVNSVVAAMQGMDAVVHLGAIVGDPACALDEELTVEVNLIATRLIAEVAKGSNISRFVFASTCSVYGASDFILDERSRLNPVSLYARSKMASECVLMKMAGSDFAPVILRFATIYGFSGRTRFDLVVNLLAAKAVKEGKITVQGGDQWRPFLHVDDAALAIVQSLTAAHADVRHQIFNVGSDEQNYTIRQVGQIIQRLAPAAEIIEQPALGDRRNYKVSFKKIHDTLDFVPQWHVEQGVQQVIDAMHAGKIKDYREAKHSNVQFLQKEASSRLIRHGNDWVYQLLNDTGSETITRPPESPEGDVKQE